MWTDFPARLRPPERQRPVRPARVCFCLCAGGLYYRSRRTRYGLTVPRADQVARAVLGKRGVGPVGYSAARAWGVTTQIPPVWHVATLRTVDPIDGVKQHDRKNLARTDLNEKEIALLELLRAPEVYVEAGWDEPVGKVRDAVKVGEVRVDVMRTVVPGEYNRAACQRPTWKRTSGSPRCSGPRPLTGK